MTEEQNHSAAVPEKSRKKKLKLGKALLITVLCTITGVIFIVTAALFYLQTKSARNLITSTVNQNIPGEIDFDRIGFSIFQGRFELKGVSLKDPEKQRIASFDRLFIDLAWRAVVHKEIRISAITLDGPEVKLIVNRNGELNLMQAFPKPKAKGPKKAPEKPAPGQFPFRIVLDSVQINEGSFKFDDFRKDVHAEVGSFNLASSFQYPDITGDLEFNVRSASFQNPELTYSLDDFQISGKAVDGKIAPFNVELDSEILDLSITASVEDCLRFPPRASVNLDARTDLADIDRMLNKEGMLTGAVDVNLTVDGDLNDPNMALTIDYGGGRVGPAVVESGTLDFILSGRLATLRKLDIHAGGGRIGVQGRADLKKVFANGFFESPDGFDALSYQLSLIGDRISLEKLIRSETPVQGAINTDISFEGVGISPESANAELKLHCTAKNMAVGANVPKLDIKIDSRAGLKEKALVLHQLDAAAGGVNLTAKGRFNPESRQVDADIDLDAPDLQSTLASLGVPGVKGDVAVQLHVAGDVDSPSATLLVSAENGAYDNIVIGDLKIDATLAESGRLTISRLNLNNSGSTISGFGKIKFFNENFSIDPETPGDLTLRLTNAEISDFVPDFGVSGTIDGEIKTELSGGELGAGATLIGRQIKTDQAAAGDVEIDLNLKNGLIVANQVSIRNRESKILLFGDFRLFQPGTMTPVDDHALNISLVSDKIRPQDFIDGAEGDIALNATFEGTVKQPQGEISISGTGLNVKDIQIGNLELSGALDKQGMLSIKTLGLQNNGSMIDGAGCIRLFDETLPVDMRLDFETLEYADFMQGNDIQGELTGHITVNGDARFPVVNISAAGKNLSAYAYRIGTVNLSATHDNGKVVIDHLNIDNNDSRAKLSGRADLFEPDGFTMLLNPEFSIDVDAPSLTLQDFNDTYKGDCSLTAEISGTLEKPAGNLELSVNNLDVGVQKAKRVHLAASADGETVFVKALEIVFADQESVTGSGRVSLDKTYQFSLKSDGVKLTRIQAIQDILDRQEINGVLSLNLNGEGDFANPAVKGELTLSSIAFDRSALNDIRIDLALKDQIVEVNAVQDFKIDGRYDLSRQNFFVTADFNDTRLTPFFRIGGLDGFSGNITGDVKASGDVQSIEDIKVGVNLTGLDISMDDLPLAASTDFKFELDSGRFSIPNVHLSVLSDGNLQIKGTGGFDDVLDVDLSGNIPLNVVSRFAEDLTDIEGDLSLTASVSGTVKAPEIDSKIDVREFQMTVPGLFQKLHGVAAHINATDKHIDIQKIEGKLDTGQFKLTGGLDLENYQPKDVKANLTAIALPIKVPDMLDLVINTDLEFSGDPDHTLLKGEAVLVEGLYYKNVNLNMNILKGVKNAGKPTKRETAPPPTEFTQPYIKNLEFDVQIKHRNSFLVDIELAQLEISPDLQLTGKLNHPVINGRAQIDSGTITYHKKFFEVKKGVIDFLNPYEIEPTLDVESEVRVRDWLIHLNISGPMDKLDFELTSKPPEEDGDIISLLVFDKTTTELIEGEGGTAQSTNQMLANLIASTIGEDFKKATGLDIFEVEANGSEDTSDQVTVTLGKELSRRITIKYALESTEGEMVQKAITEYKFLENVILNGFQDSNGIFGGEVQYRLEFR